MDEITTIISNVGFPIAAFCAMYYMCATTLKENTKAVNDCTELIKEIRAERKERENAT